MRGFQPAHGAMTKGGSRPKFANGGPVRGPGTGTSDEVQDEVPEGTYIMPADSTETLGEQRLAGMGRDVPVSLSNGEFKMPPEQVHAIGVQALDQMKNATHTPVGFAPGARAAQQEAGEPRMFFADGGVVDDERKRAPISPTNIFPQGHPSAGASVYGSGPEFGSGGQFARVPDTIGQQPGRTVAPVPPVAQPAAPQAQVQRSETDRQALVNQIPTGRGLPAAPFEPPPAAAPAARPPATAGAGPDLGAAARSAAGFVAGAFPNTANAIRESAADARAAYQQAGLGAALGQSARVAATPLIGLADDVATGAAKLLDPAAQALKTFVTGDSTPIGQDAAADGSAVPAQAAARAAPVAPRVPGGAATASSAAAPLPARGFSPASLPVATADTVQAQRVAGLPGVFRSGNSYSDSEAGAVAGAAPRGLPSARNIAAADALAARSDTESLGRVLAAGPAPQAGPSLILPAGNGFRRDSRFLAQELGAQRALQYAQGEDPASREQRARLARSNAELAAANTRALLQQRGETERARARNAIDQGRLNLEQQVRGFDIRRGQRQESALDRYMQSATPEEQQSALRNLRALSGQAEPSPWKVTVTPAGKNADGSTTEGSVIRHNAVTGQVERVDVGQGGGKGPAVGAVERGYRFKGGDPANPASWEKA